MCKDVEEPSGEIPRNVEWSGEPVFDVEYWPDGEYEHWNEVL